ncbi:hypothetical protein FS837_003520 [Tulasnella sp. UAMH 9824]|nr:hypothetical protein FS837_003520 [Tulasnella sp. UAMH 9824]
MATKPYCFEQAIITEGLRDETPCQLMHDLVGEFDDAKIVPGGEWLVTLSTERHPVLMQAEPPGARQPFVRLWQITHPVQKNFKCVAKTELPINHIPFELCLQPGDGPLELLVFVNAYKTGTPHGGGFVRALQISLAAEYPQFSVLAELETDKFCTGMCLQRGKVFVGTFTPEAYLANAFVWDWKNGGKVEVASQEAGWHWFLAISETLSALWNANKRSVDVHWSPKSDRPDEEHRHLPLPSDTLTDLPQDPQTIFPHETLRIDIENLEAGQVSFTRYSKDNTYMEHPEDPNDPFGDDTEAPKSFIQTVNGHLVDMSSSGRLTAYFASESEENTKIGESASYFPFTSFDNRDSVTYSPFMCPLSGVVGSVGESGDFYIWRMK